MVRNHFLSNTDDEEVCGVREMLVQKKKKKKRKHMKWEKSIYHKKYGFGWFSKMRYKSMPVNKNKTITKLRTKMHISNGKKTKHIVVSFIRLDISYTAVNLEKYI